MDLVVAAGLLISDSNLQQMWLSRAESGKFSTLLTTVFGFVLPYRDITVENNDILYIYNTLDVWLGAHLTQPTSSVQCVLLKVCRVYCTVSQQAKYSVNKED